MMFSRFINKKTPINNKPVYDKAITMKTIDVRINNILVTVEYQYKKPIDPNRSGSPDNWSEGEGEEIYIHSICTPLSITNIIQILDDKHIIEIENRIHSLEK